MSDGGGGGQRGSCPGKCSPARRCTCVFGARSAILPLAHDAIWAAHACTLAFSAQGAPPASPPHPSPTCVLEARSAILPLAHSAVWNAGCVDTNVVSPIARPTLLMLARSRKWPGRKGAANSHDSSAAYATEDPYLRGRGGGRAGQGGWVAALAWSPPASFACGLLRLVAPKGSRARQGHV